MKGTSLAYKDPEEKRIKDRLYHQANKERRNAQSRAYNALHAEEKRLKQRLYREEHPKYAATYSRAYYDKHKERLKANMRAYRARNKAVLNAKSREHYALQQAERVAYRRRYLKKYPERARETMRKWRQKNPETLRVLAARRRANKNQAPVNDLSMAQWNEIKEAFDHRCVYCGRKVQRLTQDHIIPLSKGGSHTTTNIVPACLSCNTRKNSGPPLKPVQPLLLTIARPRKKQRT